MYIHLYLANCMPFNLRSTTARTDNSVLPASSRTANFIHSFRDAAVIALSDGFHP